MLNRASRVAAHATKRNAISHPIRGKTEDSTRRQKGRRDSERGDVGHGVELDTELRRRPRETGDAAVETVEHAGDDDEERRHLVVSA
jgi:hypothetical protein